jgi:non-specific serine/threonine protein kinase
MEPNQARMYYDLRDKQKAEFMGENTTIVQKITLLMRLSQLVRGYMLDANDNLTRLFEAKDNPAIKEMLAALTDRTERTIIWCRFKHEIADVMEVLGSCAVPYFGDTKNDERERNLNLFKTGCVQYLVGTVDAGGIGLNMAEASHTFFYSNQFSSGKRQQAEDRNHRYGTEGALIDGELHVLYEDLVCPDTIDEYILATLMSKKEMSEYLMDFEVVYGK